LSGAGCDEGDPWLCAALNGGAGGACRLARAGGLEEWLPEALADGLGLELAPYVLLASDDLGALRRIGGDGLDEARDACIVVGIETGLLREGDKLGLERDSWR